MSHVYTTHLLSALAAVRYYAEHQGVCAVKKWFKHYTLGGNEPACTCGLSDVLRGIDAMLAGRNTGNHPEAPESSTWGPFQKESDDGN